MKIKTIIGLLLLAGFLGVGTLGIYFWRSGNWQKMVVNQVGNHLIKEEKQFNLLQQLLGFEERKIYLVLFLNNTEIRPGGGFIGTYAVVRINQGKPELLKTEGTEILDYSTSGDQLPVPPGPLKKYLLVDKWYFRDSNWYPDFKLSAEKSLALYQLEQGLEAKNIDGVIALTPTVIEEVLKLTGPLTIRGEEFNAQNFLSKTQYEVEYGFADKGVPRAERKSLLGDMAQALIKTLPLKVMTHWQTYYSLWQQMIREKQIMFYAVDAELQTVFTSQNWSGEMTQTTGDYFLWADANLGAMKTDLAISRNLFYTIHPTSTADKYLVATITMEYQHNGSFDWRTTRYRSYARVYVPNGSQLIESVGAMDRDKSTTPGQVDQGQENGRQWFGAFVSVEPGKKKRLSFTYRLPVNISAQVYKEGNYNLLVQKQLGLNGVNLHVKLNFGKNIIKAAPSETPNKLGDQFYEFDEMLRVDREFMINLD